MKLCVIGTGYVGLVSGTCFADLGNTVICVENNQEKLAVLNKGEAPFYEPGLKERMQRNFDAERLVFTDDLKKGVLESEIIMIAVGTPQSDTGEADLSAVYSVAEDVFSILAAEPEAEFKVVVTKSTVPVGTGKQLESRRAAVGIKADQVAVASNPEFLREGTAIYDFFHPDRIVLGSASQEALSLLSDLYEPLYRTETPIVRTTLETSELSKYASNAFLATKISFINEMANLCELTGADVHDISKIMGMDGRIGRYFLHAGPGYGGSCFPKDTQALIHTSKELGYDLKVVKAVEDVNFLQKERVLQYVTRVFGEDLAGKHFALLGVAFKPNTDDVRDASSRVIIKQLVDRGATVSVVDPEVKSLPEYEGLETVGFAKNSYEASKNAVAIILVTEWNAFRELDLAKLRDSMKQNYFFDLRNVYTPEKLKQAGFNPYVIGRCLISQSVEDEVVVSG